MFKHKFFIIIIFLVAVILLFVLNTPSVSHEIDTSQEGILEINNYIFDIEIVESSKDIMRGLSFRESISDNEAMLFIFSDKKIRTFWMKDMNFNIDLLWIKDNEVLGFEKNMLAPDNNVELKDLFRYTSLEEVDKVLEINSGLIDSLNIKVGDIINITI